MNTDELRKVAEAATSGSWAVSEATACVVTESLPDDGGDIIASWPEAEASDRRWPANATHIATFDPPTVLALLDRLAALEAERDKAKSQLANRVDSTRKVLEFFEGEDDASRD